jgi:hypothetical protein
VHPCEVLVALEWTTSDGAELAVAGERVAARAR